MLVLVDFQGAYRSGSVDYVLQHGSRGEDAERAGGWK